MARVLLNLDAGEHDDEPDALLATADLLNVACGGHAGDAASMSRVVRAARATGAGVGAHPSYEDRAGFGRVPMDLAPEVLGAQIAAQCAGLRAIAEALGARVGHVKLHGALYHAADRAPEIARAAVSAARGALGDVSFVGPAGGALEAEAALRGLTYLREAFADRGVRADGSLVPRGEPGALVTDPETAARRAAELAAHGDVETICVHGDTPGALAIATAVRRALGAP